MVAAGGKRSDQCHSLTFDEDDSFTESLLKFAPHRAEVVTRGMNWGRVNLEDHMFVLLPSSAHIRRITSASRQVSSEPLKRNLFRQQCPHDISADIPNIRIGRRSREFAACHQNANGLKTRRLRGKPNNLQSIPIRVSFNGLRS